MPNPPAIEQRPRRNAISEKPFAGRIGGFQQDFLDDDEGHDILKSQPDAARYAYRSCTQSTYY